MQTLTLRVAADSFMGGAQFTVAVDGVQVGGTLVASSAFGAGQFEDITLLGNFGPDPQQVSVTFINDLYEGTPATDRNLYVESLTFAGQTIAGSAATNPVGGPVGTATELVTNGTITFTLPPTPPTMPRGHGWARAASPPEIRILADIVARGFVLATKDPEVEPWVVSLVRGLTAAEAETSGLNCIMVDLSKNNSNTGSAPCAS
jgi:hypothetical protein